MKSLLARLSALPGRPLAALSIAAVLLVVVNLWGPWLGIGGARPLASPPIRWALLVIVLWGLLLWSLRRSLGGPLLGLLGLFILCGGQALGWGELRPLRALAARVLVVGLLVLGYLAWLGLRTWRRHGREHDLRQLLAALRRLLLPTPAERTHTPTAVTQVRAAQQQWRQLHARVGWRGAWQAWRARSTLPWYLVLGAAGSGKSSLLASSSLRLLRCEGEAFHRPDGDPCSWWVGERAMFVEAQALPEHPPTRSPGEPAASAADSGSVAAALPVAAEPARPADSGVSAEPVGSAWGALLGALHRRGAELALHGVVLTLECAWLLRASPEQRAEAAGLMRRRLLQLHATLGSHLPVYLVLTKADSLTGFEEFFRAVDTHARGGLRDALWGFILPWGRSGAASPGRALEVGQEFALLQQGLQALLPVCLQHEAALARRCRMFEFPHAHAELWQRLQEWLQIVFAQWPGPQTRARAWAPDDGPASGAAHGAAHGTARGLVLRGVFLGSCGGLRDSSPDAGSGERFTAGLLRDGLLEDTALARPDDPRLRRRRVRRGAAAGAMLIGGAAALYGLHASYAQTREQLGVLQQQGQRLRERVDGAVQAGPRSEVQWQGALAAAQQLADEAHDTGPAGLFTALALQPVREASDSVLLRMQQALLLPPLLRRMREQLELAMRHERMEEVMETLDAYLMLHDPGHYDARRLRAWALRNDAGDDVVHALEQPVGAWQARSAPDADLVRSSRAWLLRCSRGQRLWYLVRTRLPRQQEPAGFNLAALQAGQPQRSFELASGRPDDTGVAGWYSERCWREQLAPRLPELAARAAADDAWLVGEAPTTTTAAEPMVEELRHAYWLEYARHWSAFLGDIRPVTMPGLEQQLQLVRAMASEDSPLLDLTRRAWQELRPLQASDTAQGDPVARRLLALRPYGDPGADGQAVRSLREALQAFATTASLGATETAAGQADAGAMEQARARLVAQAGALPAPLGNVLSGLADDTAQRVLGAGSGLARKQAEQVFARLRGAFDEQVVAPCARTLAGHFPLSRQGPDANIDDFVGFFGPGGSAQRYFDDYLKPWVDSSRRPWRYRAAVPQAAATPADGLSAQATQELLHLLAQRGPDPDAFARIARVRGALWRQEGAAPSWGFDLSVPSMDPGLTMLRLQVDGQAMRYAHGPVQAWAARWPGPQPAAGARLRLESADAAAPIELSAQGPWAWMHLLADGRRRPAGADAGVDLEYGPAGHRVVLHLGGAEPNPWKPGVLEGFTCPR